MTSEPLPTLPHHPPGIVFVVIFRLFEVGEAVRMWKTDRRDLLIGLATCVVVACYTVSTGLLVGVVLQWISGYTRSYELRSDTAVVDLCRDSEGSWEVPGSPSGDPTVPPARVAILRFGGTDLQFAQAHRILAHVAEAQVRSHPWAHVGGGL